VRRALPAGAGRATIERSAMVFIWGVMFLDYIGKLDGVICPRFNGQLSG
jgi:hypothetical protein